MTLTKNQWIEMYGGPDLLAAEGFDVVPATVLIQPVKGWQVRRKPKLCPHGSKYGCMLCISNAISQISPSIERA